MEQAHATSNGPSDPRLAMLHQISRALTHDLRTPLTVIRNALFFLRRRTPADAEVAESLDMIESEVVAINTILTHVMQITDGTTPPKKEVELRPLVDAAIHQTDPSRTATWRVEFPAKATIVCEPGQLEHVFVCLFENAMTAMHGRGEVHVSSRRDAAADMVEVRDSGPGVAAEIRERIFEPLVTTKRSGLGLGLTYCREILRKHGGAIELASTAPTGTTMRMTLPRTAQTA